LESRSRRPSQRIEHPRENDEPAGPVESAAVPSGRDHHRPDAEEQVEQREQARHDDDDAPHVGPEWRWPHAPSSASTVAPAATRSPPSLGRAAGWPAGGRRRPAKPETGSSPAGPLPTLSPTLPSVTMRRAIDPAIWRTSTGPRGPRMPIDACSLSRPPSPRRRGETARVVPHQLGRVPPPDSGDVDVEHAHEDRDPLRARLEYMGSSTSARLTTLPSAGAITTPSPRGPVRSGSRKKTSSHTAITSSGPR